MHVHAMWHPVMLRPVHYRWLRVGYVSKGSEYELQCLAKLEAFIEHLPRAPRPYFIVWVRSQWSGSD